jgi:peptide/nickel transport system substrate-binding protein
MKMKKLFLFILIITIFLTACSNSNQTAQQTDNKQGESGNNKKSKDSLQIAMSVAPPTLDYHLSTTQATQQVAGHIFETLVTMDKNYEVVPFLAKEYKVSADGKQLTFILRKGVKFHNGKEMTADDVIASLKRWSEKSSFGRAALSKMTSISKTDDLTVVLQFSEPSSVALSAIAYPIQAAAIMPQEVINEADEKKGIKDYIGTGPYKFTEWKADQYIKLTKFDDYQALESESTGLGGKRAALIKDLYFVPVTDAASRVAGLQSGKYDFADEIPIDNYEKLASDKNIVTEIAENRRYNSLMFNTSARIFSNVKMRQAVAAALNLEEVMLASSGNPKFFELNGGLMFPKQSIYVDTGVENYNQKNSEKAKQLLNEAGYKGEPVVILSTKDYEFIYKSSLVVKSQLEAAGMKVDLQIYDWPSLVSVRSDKNKWDMFFTFFLPYIDPTQTLYLDSRNKFPGWYNNPNMDQLLDKIRLEFDAEKRKNTFKEVQQLFWNDVPSIKLGNVHGLIGYSKDLNMPKFFYDNFFWNVQWK